MSPRRNRGQRPGEPLDPARTGAVERIEEWDGLDWVVRSIRGSSSTKSYRCPGCDQEIPPVTPHVVVWPQQALAGSGLDERRHWHTSCWQRRDRRRPR